MYRTSKQDSGADPVESLHYSMRQVVSLGASDLHIKVGAPPYVRLHGELTPLPGTYTFSADEIEQVVLELCRGRKSSLEEFRECGDTDLAYALPGVARFRCNIFRRMGDVAIALRVVSEQVPPLGTLGLPRVVEQFADIPRGLVLVTGATGSGKTTTVSGIIDLINERYSRHIVTVEDPVEMVHRDKSSVVNQREVGRDVASFRQGLRRALRQDPDVVVIGEMRDEETVRTALSAAETGHLVLSTLHTIDVMETVYRILDFFPPELERQARNMLAGTLMGIISQRLIRTHDGRGRVPAAEVLIGTARIADAIVHPEKTGYIHDMISEGGFYGMQTFDQSLLQHVVDGRISVDDGIYHSSTKQNFLLMLEAAGVELDLVTRRRASGDVNAEELVTYTDDGPAIPPPPRPYGSIADGDQSVA